MEAVAVQLFARYAELVGADEVAVPADRAGTIGELVQYLRSLPGGDAIPERPLVAVNCSQVDGEYRPLPGDEIALLPPMAGG